MSTTGKRDEFERRLAQTRRQSLPPEWREEILDNACAAAGRRGVVIRLWGAVPKAVAVPVAACWVAIAVLRATTPTVEVAVGASKAGESMGDEAVQAMFVIWIEGKRDLEGELVGDEAL